MLQVLEVSGEKQLQDCFAIRLEVFVAEQNVPAVEEVDDLDRAPSTVHLLALEDGLPVGTLRILPTHPGLVHIGRVAVRKNARGLGVGRELMGAAHDICAQRFSHGSEVRCELSAQVQAIGFYESLGYKVVSEKVYFDAGIEHKDLALSLAGV